MYKHHPHKFKIYVCSTWMKHVSTYNISWHVQMHWDCTHHAWYLIIYVYVMHIIIYSTNPQHTPKHPSTRPSCAQLTRRKWWNSHSYFLWMGQGCGSLSGYMVNYWHLSSFTWHFSNLLTESFQNIKHKVTSMESWAETGSAAKLQQHH